MFVYKTYNKLLIFFYSCSHHVNTDQRHVDGVAQLGGGQVHQARDGRGREHGRAVVDRGDDGPGQRVEPADGRLPDGPGGQEADHCAAGAAVHSLVAADAVRADHVVAVHGPADGGHGQGHIVHGGARVPGRDRGRGRARRAQQRVLPAAALGLHGRGRGRAARLVPHAERRVGRGAGRVPGGRGVGARVAALPAEARPAGGRGPVPAVVPVR